MKTIDLTPTREGYIIMLKAIIEGTLNRGFDPDDAAWAKEELTKLEKQA
tara:strand:+ start:2025 stop:2171 length:147 start_codon:yes stop_codon:yes gene_type:complete